LSLETLVFNFHFSDREGLIFRAETRHKDLVKPFFIFAKGGKPMKFKPLHDRILVRRIDADETTRGGIIIPDTAKEKPAEGKVIAAGEGARDDAGKRISLDVSVGDHVLFGKWSGTEVKIDGEDLLIMKESDVMGIVDTSSEVKQAA
jgi:chaperonin GroES